MRFFKFAISLSATVLTGILLAPLPSHSQTPAQDALRLRTLLQSEIIRILTTPGCDNMQQAMRLIDAAGVLSARYPNLASTRSEVAQAREQLQRDLLSRGCVSPGATVRSRTAVITVRRGAGGGVKNRPVSEMALAVSFMTEQERLQFIERLSDETRTELTQYLAENAELAAEIRDEANNILRSSRSIEIRDFLRENPATLEQIRRNGLDGRRIAPVSP